MDTVAPPDGLGLFVAAGLAVLVVTPTLSALVLWRYRRAVAGSMRAGRERLPIRLPPVAARPVDTRWSAPPRPVMLRRVATVGGGEIGKEAGRRMRSLAGVYTAAGAVFGLLVASAALWAFGLEFELQRWTTVAVLLMWPLVPTLLLVLAARRRTQVVACVGYLTFVPLLTVGTQARLAETLNLVAVVIIPPVVMLIALSGRNLRAVGPFLAAPVLTVSVGLLFWPWTAYFLFLAGSSGAVARAGSVVAALVVGPVGFGYLVWSARAYARKRASDQALLITQWWFLATAWHSALLIPSGPGAAASVWLGFLAFRTVVEVGLRLRSPAAGGAPLRLLLLRTFGARRRSEVLLHRLGAYWRHLGTVQIIAGTDLAAATLEPHEFLDRLRGRFDRLFIGDAEHLNRRLGELDDRPDPDGRYRVNDLFCHDNAWRAALHALLHRSDCVLVDVRGFTPQRRGVAYEIAQIVQLAPVDRVLMLADHTTDRGFLGHVVADASGRLDPGAPNRSGGHLRVLHLDGAGRLEPGDILGLLAAPVPRPLVPHMT